MKYMLLICLDEDSARIAWEDEGFLEAGMAWAARMDARGVRLEGTRLQPGIYATKVQVRAGQTLVADGPFAETKEQIVGYDILECADLDEAIGAAAQHPVARLGTIEVRPFWQG